MCRQFLCFVCDRPLTGEGSFLQCQNNPDARPPWLEPFRSTELCHHPIYLHNDYCHEQCNIMRLQAQAYTEQQLGIQKTTEYSDGSVDWQRVPYFMNFGQPVQIPQTRALLFSQHEHLEIPYDASMIPQEAVNPFVITPDDSPLIEEMIAAGLHDQTPAAFDPQSGNMDWSNDQQGDEITYEGKGKGKEKEGDGRP